MATETGIGALAIRLSADIGDFLTGMDRAVKALNKKKKAVEESMIGVGKLGAAVSAAAAGVAMFTLRATNMAEQLGKLSEKTGISVEQLSALKYAAHISDVSIESLAKGMNILSKNMLDARSGAGEARNAFKALGVSVEDNEGKIKSTDTMLLDLADRFEKMENGPLKVAYSMRVFGKAGAELIPFLNMGRAGIEELRKEAERLGIILDTRTVKAAQEFNDNLKRLQSTADALSVHLTSNLVKALNETSKEMLKAKTEGADLFETLLRGMARLAIGSDLHQWNKEMTEAVSKEHALNNRLLEARARLNQTPTSTHWRREVEARTEALQKQQAVLNGLRARRPTPAIEAEEAAGKPGKTGGDAPPGLSSEDLKASTQKALADVDEMIARVMTEKGGDAGDQFATRIIESISGEKIKKDLDDALSKLTEQAMLGGAFEDENQGAKTENADKIVALQESLKTAEDLEQESFARKMAQLRSFSEEELAHLGGFNKVKEQLQLEHDERLAQIRSQADHRHKTMSLQAARTFFGNMSQLMNTNSRKMFEIGKKAAIAETVINTYSAAMGAYKSLSSIPIIGPALGAAAAGAAIAFGMAQVQNIRSQEFGGGGGAVASFPANPTTGAAAGTPADVGGGGSGGGKLTTIINLQGETFGRDQVRKLIEAINENTRDGGRLIVK